MYSEIQEVLIMKTDILNLRLVMKMIGLTICP